MVSSIDRVNVSLNQMESYSGGHISYSQLNLFHSRMRPIAIAIVGQTRRQKYTKTDERKNGGVCKRQQNKYHSF